MALQMPARLLRFDKMIENKGLTRIRVGSNCRKMRVFRDHESETGKVPLTCRPVDLEVQGAETARLVDALEAPHRRRSEGDAVEVRHRESPREAHWAGIGHRLARSDF